MFNFFKNKFATDSSDKTNDPAIHNNTSQHPFTTQKKVLEEHHILRNDKGDEVGMCDGMTAAYATAAIAKQDTKTLLSDSTNFIKEAIKQEDEEDQAERTGEKDINHHFFRANQLPHTDIEVAPGELVAQMHKAIQNNDHVIATVHTPTHDNPNLQHEVYLGRIPSSSACRFFDANIPGGERTGPCDKLIHDFHSHLKKFDSSIDLYPANLGVSRGFK